MDSIILLVTIPNTFYPLIRTSLQFPSSTSSSKSPPPNYDYNSPRTQTPSNRPPLTQDAVHFLVSSTNPRRSRTLFYSLSLSKTSDRIRYRPDPTRIHGRPCVLPVAIGPLPAVDRGSGGGGAAGRERGCRRVEAEP